MDAMSTEFRKSPGCEHMEPHIRDKIHRLHTIIDQLSNVKEFGTPQGIKAMSRCYISLIIPLVFGPYWAYISTQSDFAVAFFCSLAFQFAISGLLNVSITLEDPFDNVGLCGIFIDEQLYEVEQALDTMKYTLLSRSASGRMNGEDPDVEHVREIEEDGVPSNVQTPSGRRGHDTRINEGTVDDTQHVVRVTTDNV